MAAAVRPGGNGGSAASTGLLEAFRKPDFNVAAFVRDATGQGHDRLGRLTQQLEDRASSLDEELQREIVACHEELLKSAGSVSDLDGQLGDVRDIVAALKNSIARMRGDVLSPFAGVKRRTELLERMQAVNALIRRLRRFLQDARTLRTQMEGPRKDYSKAAHTLHELEAALAEGSLDRVDTLRAEVAWIRETGAKIRRQAEDDLRAGTRQGNQIVLSTAIQVLFNLQVLKPQLMKLQQELLQELAQAQLVTGPGFQQSLEVNLQILVAQTQRMNLLEELIDSRTDPLTHRKFSTALQAADGSTSSIVRSFWSEAMTNLKAKFTRISQDRGARKSLLMEFPKVLSLLSEAADKAQSRLSRSSGIASADAREALCGVVAELRTEFLQESIRRVTEPVEMMLPDKLLQSLTASGETTAPSGPAQVAGVAPGASGDAALAEMLPTSHDLRRYAQLLAAELERTESCPETLLKEALKNVRNSILLFSTRLEHVIDSSCIEVKCFEDETKLRLRSPLPLPEAGHARNARLYGILHHTLAALKEAIPARFQGAVVTQQVQASLQEVQTAIASPMFAALQRTIQTSLALPPAALTERNADGSLALLAVGHACAHVSRYYFALFGTGQLLPYVKDLCVFLVRHFLSAAVLSKPCGEARRQELLQDMQTLETMMSALDTDFQSHIRHEAGVFREFRKLLFAKSLESLDFEELVKVIPLHLLLTFLVHQLPAEVPSLPFFCSVTPAAYLKETLLPLWDEPPAKIASYKATVADLSDRHSLDPTESTVHAFIIAQSV